MQGSGSFPQACVESSFQQFYGVIQQTLAEGRAQERECDLRRFFLAMVQSSERAHESQIAALKREVENALCYASSHVQLLEQELADKNALIAGLLASRAAQRGAGDGR